MSGANKVFDEDRLHAPVSRCVIFGRPFFDHVAEAVFQAAAFPGRPAGDGSEYDAEESKQTLQQVPWGSARLALSECRRRHAGDVSEAGNASAIRSISVVRQSCSGARYEKRPSLRNGLPVGVCWTRSAVRREHPSDVDDANEARRLYSAAYVLRHLARRFIAKELSVSEDAYCGD